MHRIEVSARSGAGARRVEQGAGRFYCGFTSNTRSIHIPLGSVDPLT